MSDTDIARAVLTRNLNPEAFPRVHELCRALGKKNYTPRFVDDSLLAELETAAAATRVMANYTEELLRVGRAAHRLGSPIE